jgi:hypothetical protein
MAKRKKNDQEEEQQPAQQYDTTFKDWLRQAARSVLPLFLPGATYEETLDVEIIKPTMRADKVFIVMYRGKKHILHIEFETGTDPHMKARLLIYNAVLYYDHHLPVISMIVYPFRTSVARSPLQVSGEDGDIITFHFLILPLFLQEAEHYVREHIVSMYPLLPTMRGTNHVMIKQVIKELEELYRDDEVTLSQQYVWMKLLLDRTETIDSPEKARIQEELKMYDRLWTENPEVQKTRAEGKAEGEIQALQRAVVTVVKARFPALAELAQQKVAEINKPDVLNFLLEQISIEPDEAAVRALLRPIAA